MAEVAEPVVPHTRLDNMVMNVKTMIVAFFVILSSIVGGTWAIAQAAGDIDTNTKDIEQLKTVQTTAVADVKRGISDNAAAIDKISDKFDLLLQELVIREVVRPAPAPPTN